MILARKTSGQSLAHADIKFDHHVVSANNVPLKIPSFPRMMFLNTKMMILPHQVRIQEFFSPFCDKKNSFEAFHLSCRVIKCWVKRDYIRLRMVPYVSLW